MRFEVTGYCGETLGHPHSGCFRCRDEKGVEWILDLHTDATFPEDPDDPKQLVGRTIEVERVEPYTPLYFGCEVRIVT